MRETLRDKERLLHIIEAIDTIRLHDYDYWEKALDEDPIIFYGLTKLIEIIGEAVYRLTKEFRDSHPEVAWDDIEGMRHILVHDYYVTSKRVILEVVRTDLDPLYDKITCYMRQS